VPSIGWSANENGAIYLVGVVVLGMSYERLGAALGGWWFVVAALSHDLGRGNGIMR
jgi:hypothetical protein